MAQPQERDRTRAELFEDEKRRIIDSCFSKKDDDGSVLETYITHIKITEYSGSPTAPPAPHQRTPTSEKQRTIIVAVRKSGRVRLHKSKENPNGTFSIGKTWNLDDLSAIESYTSATVNADHKAWAGDVGFLITLGKPYYWQAQTDKEKKFFIASLVKIYNKYTGGRTPVLTGFDQRELDQVLGGQGGRANRPPPPRVSPGVAGPAGSAGQPGPPHQAGGSTVSSTSSTLIPPSDQSYTPPQPPPSRGQMMANGGNSPARSFDTASSRPQEGSLRRLAVTNKSQDSVANSFATRSDDSNSLRPRSRNGANGIYATPPPEPKPADDRPPERRRPPMDPLRTLQQPDRDLVPAPLMSPGMRREPVVPPRSTERMSPRASSTRRADSGTLSERAYGDMKPPERPNFNERAVSDRSVGSDRSARTVVPTEGSKLDLPGAFPASPPVGQTPSGSASQTPQLAPSPLAPSPSITPAPTPVSPVESPISPPPEPEDNRPGLGPMIKAKKSKNEVAGAFWKAAAAANAFKPRPGGAGERLRQNQNQNKNTDGPDGITSVVPAPPRVTSAQKTPTPVGSPEPPARSPGRNSAIPEVKVTVPNSSRPTSVEQPVKEVKKADEIQEKEERKSIISGNDAKYLASLGIDSSILDARGSEFAKWLDYFGWVPGEQMQSRTFDAMKHDVQREINKAQMGGWLARFHDEDERVNAIKKGIDVAINECDELDNLLTLYSVELSTLNDDIAYIEAQGQGLQVQAANQKLLKKELESLLQTCAISASDLEALRVAPLESPSGVEEIESALVTLYKAMAKIEPTSARRSEDNGSGQAVGFNSDFGSMRIVQEKKEMYTTESSAFMRRLVEFMARQFDTAYAATRRSLEGPLAKKLDPTNFDIGRSLLWQYHALVLYTRDMDPANWDRIIQTYQGKSSPVYSDQIKNVLSNMKNNARKPGGDESELLFTSLQEKKEEGIATTARKLTVKRSQTLARTLRSPLGEGSRTNLVEKSSTGRQLAYEVLANALDELLPLVEMEQNFIVDFFHATSLEQADFPDVVATSRPKDRRGNDLRRHRLMEPNREIARRVTKAMEVIFVFLEKELTMLQEWVLSQDPLQGVGVLASLERKMADMSQSNQDFLNTLLQKLHSSLETRFRKFVDEQIRAIEDTKVKIKKRKGVIGFMRIFPNFLTAVENQLATIDPHLPVRRMVDAEYDRMIRTMFDSLKVIAREMPAASAAMPGAPSVNTTSTSTSTTDPEEKLALNYHILLIENMNHYLEEVDNPRQLEVLSDWREAAQRELAEHLSLYLNAVMRRPLGRLLEHLENIEAQRASGKAPAAIAAQPSNSKAVFHKILSGYDAKEVRKGIETLRKRIEKHFGDADEPGASQRLIGVVLEECAKFYAGVETRILKVTDEVYGGEVVFEWPRAEVRGAFGVVGR
ncbi:exocyst complex component Sec3-domain-containing protein [Coniochaeta sp. 2T2.1]|nr:exocyst complex component Sec3-domain-containing protein [Coniochaeta sp. 2T2.1]